MKNLLLLFAAYFAVSMFSLQSCKKGENPLKPYETSDHPMVWQYNFEKNNAGSKTIPALDEKGNIYFAVQQYESDPVSLFAIDKAGNKLWSKEIAGALASQLIYQNNHLYFSVAEESPNSITYCLVAETGAVSWQKESRQNTGCVMAVSNNYILTGAKTGGYITDIEDTWEVQILDKTGKVVTSWKTGYGIAAVSIVDNKFYVIGHHVSGTGYHKIELVKFDIATDTIEWKSLTGMEEQNWRVASPDLVVDKNDKVYFVSQFGLYVQLNIINADGSHFKEIELNNVNNIILTPSLDAEGNIYIGAPGHIQKYSPDGEFLWTFDDYDYTTATINVTYAPPLASGDMIYYGGEGLFAVKTSPDMLWIKYPETHFTSPGYPVLNSDGDIIVVGNGYVSCIKGDGQHLLNSAWPKVFQNNGNTASR